MIEIHPLTGINEVLPGSDLVEILADTLVLTGLWPFQSQDALIVTQKIVSKAENRFVDLRYLVPGWCVPLQ
jgi:coenzyme F420-0:L-glutamate ligase/coenzyme F420-1:gamma-L-glutamate ligase